MCERSNNGHNKVNGSAKRRPQSDGYEQHSKEIPNNLSDVAASFSLKALLPSGRFLTQQDIRFNAISESAADSSPDQLAVYRIGQDCPSRVVADATARGAAGILTEQVLPSPIPQCIVGDIEIALASIAAEVADRPDRKLLNIAVMGSAGKTTSTLLIASLLRASGIRTAYWNDLGDCDGVVQSTPKSHIPCGSALINWLNEAVENQCAASVIEISEEQARHGKYDAIEFDMIVIAGTTSSADDFGPLGVQCALECLTANGVVVAPADDQSATRVIREAGVRMVSYGVRKAADVTAKIIEQADGLSTLLVSHQETSAVMETQLCGAAMAANHAAAAMVGLLLDQSLPEIAEKLGQLNMVPGRGQRLIEEAQPTVILETGGTVDRLTQSLRTHRSMRGHGKLWCVFAIADDQQNTELAEAGSRMERFSDRIVLTATSSSKSTFMSRSHEVLDGVENSLSYRLVADRIQAVSWALQQASPSDTVVVFTNESNQTPYQQRSDLRQLRRCVEQNWQTRKLGHVGTTNKSKPNLSIFG